MIDFEEMSSCQRDGLSLIDSLQGDEKDILQHYCSLATEVLLKEGTRRQAPVEQLVVNAMKSGISLGLMLSVANGEVYSR